MRHYSNTAVDTTLSSDVTSSGASITVASTAGFPAHDFVLLLDGETANRELVLVTGVSGTTLTVTRGHDSTTAVAHSAGASVSHTHSAADFKDSRDHEAATSDVHGVSGSLVGTTDAQTLSHKDLSSATNTFPGTLATDVELNNLNTSLLTNINTHAAKTTGTHGVDGTFVGTSDTQALTNKDLSSATNTLPDSLYRGVTADDIVSSYEVAFALDKAVCTTIHTEGGVSLAFLYIEAVYTFEDGGVVVSGTGNNITSEDGTICTLKSQYRPTVQANTLNWSCPDLSLGGNAVVRTDGKVILSNAMAPDDISSDHTITISGVYHLSGLGS